MKIIFILFLLFFSFSFNLLKFYIKVRKTKNSKIEAPKIYKDLNNNLSPPVELSVWLSRAYVLNRKNYILFLKDCKNEELLFANLFIYYNIDLKEI